MLRGAAVVVCEEPVVQDLPEDGTSHDRADPDAPFSRRDPTELRLEPGESSPHGPVRPPVWRRRGPLLAVASGVAALALAGALVLVLDPDGGSDRLSAEAATRTTATSSPTSTPEPEPEPVAVPTAEPTPETAPVVAVVEASPAEVAAVAAPSPATVTTAPAPADAAPPPAATSAPPVRATAPAASSSTITVEVENRTTEEAVLRVLSGPDTPPGVAVVPPGERREIRYEPDPNTYVGLHAYLSWGDHCADVATLSEPRPTGTFVVVIEPVAPHNPDACPTGIDLRRPDGTAYPYS
jgi:hypothetical protein